MAGPVGDLSLFGVLDPQPDFNILAESRAVISPDGRYVFLASPGEVAGFDSAVLSAWLGRDRIRIVSRIPQGTTRISQPVLSPNGRRLAVAGASGQVIFFEVNPLNGTLIQTGSIFPGGLISGDHRPVFSGDGSVVYYGNSNAPGQLFVLDADPAGGIDTVPLQTITLGSSLEAYRLAVSGDGTTLVVAALKQSGLNDDSLITYDIAAGTGLLTERGRFEPGVDLGWEPHTNPVVHFNGIDAHVIDVPNQQVLQIDISSAAPGVLDQAPTLASPQTLTRSEQDNVLLCVCPSGVVVYALDGGTTTGRGIFQPPGVAFAPENNAVLNPDGTLGAVASMAMNRVYSFSTFPAGLNAVPLDSFPAQQSPAAIAGGFEMQRLLVLNTNESAVDEIAGVLEVETPDGTLVRRTELMADLSFGPENTVALNPNGVATHATSSDLMVTFSNVTNEEVQTVPPLARLPLDGRHVVISGDGSTLAANSDTQVFLYTDLYGDIPSGIFDVGGANFPNARMALTESGDFLFVPDSVADKVYVIDTSTTGTFDDGSPGVQSHDLPSTSAAAWATLAPSGLLLSIALPGTSQVITFDVNPTTGALSNSRTQDLPTPPDINNNPIFLSTTRGAIGAGSSVYLCDLTTNATFPLDVLSLGDGTGTLAPVPGESRFLAMDHVINRAFIVELASGDSLSITGSLDSLSLASDAVAAVAPDGIAVVPIAGVSSGGLLTLNTERLGPTDQFLTSDVTGITSQLAIDQEGITVASLDQLNGSAVVHHIARSAPPRIVRAVLVEDEGTVNGVGDPGELVYLSFDRPVFPSELFPIPNTYLFITGGGSTGDFAALVPDVYSNFNQVILVLGAGTNGITAAGGAVGIDIAAAAPPDLFQAIGDGVAAIDLGRVGVNDSGVDIVLPMGLIAQAFTPGIRLLLQLPVGDDYAFTGHLLDIPADALAQGANFSMGPPTAGNLPSGFANAVQISTDASDLTNLFNPPATLTLEYDPAAFNNGAGQFEYLGARIIQIVDLGSGPEGIVIPGPFTIDTDANTVSALINNLDPTGLSATSAARNQNGASVGTFATLPVNPVEERSIFLTPGGTGDPKPAQASVALTSGDGSAYTLHSIEFPGYVETTESDPTHIEVSIRMPTLFERVSTTGGQSFPTQSAALFVIETTDASDNPVAFTDAVNLTVEFIERTKDNETDTVDFDSVRGHASQMRIVHDATDGTGVNFTLVGGT
ncbi:hypothetical protein JXA47_08210, partial [Candidatus Sumerlaeota bacterium]|nr:hypothetical protein [Candidatus Sumerlaeota bacterium]